MESDERPTKKRRLSHEDHSETTETLEECPNTAAQPSENGVEGSVAAQNGHDQENTPSQNPSDSFPAPSDTAPLSGALETSIDGQPLSKNAQKKLRKKLEWESKRDERRVIRKEKIKEKKERRRERFRQEAVQKGDSSNARAEKARARKHVQLPITFLIDCDFDDLMLDKERISLASQITRSYSDNRKAPFQAHLGFCSFGGKLRERFDNVLTHYKGWKGVHYLDCDFVEAAEKAKEWMMGAKGGTLAGAFSSLATDSEEDRVALHGNGEIVYLTSESNETLTELKPYSTYIIGGLVDKNREKGICYKRATRRGVRTAKLPIGEFMEMRSRKVLATNHVNEVMVRWLECGDWGEAFLRVIPKRKGGKLKERESGEHDEGHESVAEEESDVEPNGMESDEEEVRDEEEGDLSQSVTN